MRTNTFAFINLVIKYFFPIPNEPSIGLLMGKLRYRDPTQPIKVFDLTGTRNIYIGTVDKAE